LTNAIHIVSFDVPFPANYGGVIDVYYKLAWLKKSGVKIHLHCFTYGRKPAPELEALCETVHYYERKTGLLSNVSLLPYTVRSRQSKALEKKLLADDLPILFEVLHTCYLLKDARFKNRKKIYRHSNIEHDYYLELAKTERRFLKKTFLKIEAWKLKRFESILNFADLILAVNQKDTDYFKQQYPNVKSVYLPSFHPNAEVTSKTGKSDYLLFHGNLSISENYEAALWLTAHVFSKVNYKVIIAGLNPPAFLKEAIKDHSNIQLIASPVETEMDALVHHAQAHVLYTAQPTGLKLKLLNVLFKGRFVICNSHMISGTGLSRNTSFLIADQAQQFIDEIHSIMPVTFSEQMIDERKALTAHFDNLRNSKKFMEVVF
jgi:hypothetical protein